MDLQRNGSLPAPRRSHPGWVVHVVAIALHHCPVPLKGTGFFYSWSDSNLARMASTRARFMPESGKFRLGAERMWITRASVGR